MGINADINGSINIARKVTRQYEFQLDARSLALRRFDNDQAVKIVEQDWYLSQF